MTAEPNPFPTVAKLADECGEKWPRFHDGARETVRIEGIFKEAIQTERSRLRFHTVGFWIRTPAWCCSDRLPDMKWFLEAIAIGLC